MGVLAILLTLSINSTIQEAECWIDGGTRKAPLNVEWPKDLPESVKTDGGTFLPVPLDNEIARRLNCLWRWPKVCQTIIDAWAGVEAEQLKIRDDQILALQTELAKVTPQPPTAWPTWAVAAFSGGGIVLGILATVGGYQLFNK